MHYRRSNQGVLPDLGGLRGVIDPDLLLLHFSEMGILDRPHSLVEVDDHNGLSLPDLLFL